MGGRTARRTRSLLLGVLRRLGCRGALANAACTFDGGRLAEGGRRLVVEGELEGAWV